MGRLYIEVPGVAMHELPPLLVHGIPEDSSREDLVERAAAMVETEDMIADVPPDTMEHRKLDLALHLTDQYFGLLSHWAWGDSVLEWIRQCEITFASTSALRPLWNGDIWPHAARSQLCGPASRQTRAHTRRCIGQSRWHAPDVPAATPYRLLLEPIPLLPE